MNFVDGYDESGLNVSISNDGTRAQLFIPFEQSVELNSGVGIQVDGNTTNFPLAGGFVIELEVSALMGLNALNQTLSPSQPGLFGSTIKSLDLSGKILNWGTVFYNSI